jgi:hypothetical protein
VSLAAFLASSPCEATGRRAYAEPRAVVLLLRCSAAARELPREAVGHYWPVARRHSASRRHRTEPLPVLLAAKLAVSRCCRAAPRPRDACAIEAPARASLSEPRQALGDATSRSIQALHDTLSMILTRADAPNLVVAGLGRVWPSHVSRCPNDLCHRRNRTAPRVKFTLHGILHLDSMLQ